MILASASSMAAAGMVAVVVTSASLFSSGTSVLIWSETSSVALTVISTFTSLANIALYTTCSPSLLTFTSPASVNLPSADTSMAYVPTATSSSTYVPSDAVVADTSLPLIAAFTVAPETAVPSMDVTTPLICAGATSTSGGVTFSKSGSSSLQLVTPITRLATRSIKAPFFKNLNIIKMI